MKEAIRPADTAQLCEAIAQAAAASTPLELRGGGSKTAIGAPERQAQILDMRAFAGIVDYDPAELVLTVGAATPLIEIEALVTGEGQMLAFEPFDHAPLFGASSGVATIGGVVGAAVSGPRRLSAGAVRDHLLGFEAVSGRGEAFVGGGKVVKNVTGYDLPKLMAGSWGRLAALTLVTLKVLPRARVQATLVLDGLEDEAAVAAMARAAGSPAEVAAAAHLPEERLTALRIEGFAPSVEARCAMVARLLGASRRLSDEDAQALWRSVALAEPLAGAEVLWRASVAPSRGAALFRALEPLGGRRLYDWAGGLVWLGLPAGVDQSAVRRAAEASGGHATLVRAPADLRARIPALHPEPPALSALSSRVRTAFDPAGILSPDRFGGR